MPHSHSPEASERRRERAAARGYLVPKGEDYRWMRLHKSIVSDVKVMADSLHLHRQHEEVVGQKFNFARHAALAAERGEQLRAAHALHRRANRAKHGGGPRSLEAVPPVDPVFVRDPWASWCSRGASTSSTTATSSASSAVGRELAGGVRCTAGGPTAAAPLASSTS